jgi:dihydrofolate reductase
MSLIYSMLMSVDGYVEDEHGRFDWAAPDEEVHSYINQLESSVGTYLYGRRMYETMIYWETAHSVPTSRSSYSTGRGSGRRPRRSSTPGPSPSRAAGERGSSASSIPT